MSGDLFDLIIKNDLEGLRSALAANKALSNEGVALCIDGKLNCNKGHPLHRICDAVFAKKISDPEAISIAKIFPEHGSNIDGFMDRDDLNTPVLAAAGLHAEQLGIFYIEQGANFLFP